MKFNPLIPGSQFSKYHDWHMVYSPALSLDWLHDLLEQDLPVDKEDDSVVKLDESSSILKLESDLGYLAVKHYHKCSITSVLGNTFGQTPAHRSWSYAHYLINQGLVTPEPLAFIEERRMGLRWRSWYISRFDESVDCEDYFMRSQSITPAMANTASAIVDMFFRLKESQLSHGNMSASNLLISENQPSLIDLEQMKFHTNKADAERMWLGDIQQFMDSWRERFDVYKKFKQIFSKRGIELKQ